MLTITKLSKIFRGNVQALQDVSFEIHDNEIFGLLGPNGAGKTTTLRILSTILAKTSGEVLYDGKKAEANLVQLRRSIGFLSAEIKLEGCFTPNELARYYGGLYDLSPALIEQRKNELFSYFGITDFANRRYDTFSTGMKQKTSLAITLLNDPGLVILDEPTNGLDVLTQKAIEDAIVEMKRKGKTIILSTHMLDLAERLSDRIGVIIDGKSVFCGTSTEMQQFTGKPTTRDAFLYLYEQNHSKNHEDAQ